MNELTNAETFELLQKYPQPAVEAALVELGYSANSKSFPLDIVEKVEGIIDSVEVAQQKVLTSTPEAPKSQEPQEEAIVVQEISNLASLDSRNVGIDSKVLVAVAQAIVVDSRHKARLLGQLQRETFVRALQEGNNAFETDLLRAVADNQKKVEKLFSDKNIEKMVSQAVTPHDDQGFNVDWFLKEVNTTIQDQNRRADERAAAKQKLDRESDEFDVDSFLSEMLDEVWGKG